MQVIGVDLNTCKVFIKMNLAQYAAIYLNHKIKSEDQQRYFNAAFAYTFCCIVNELIALKPHEQ